MRAYSKDAAVGNPLWAQPFHRQYERARSPAMQQLPPFPDTPTNPEPVEPSQPGQPSPAPSEEPATTPNIDVPSPSSPGTEPPTTPISPVG
jgi:hypothetical protein